MNRRQIFLLVVLPILVLTALAQAVPTPAQVEDTPITVAIDGRVIAETTCATCHSTMLIRSARKSRTNWQATIKKMEKNGMPPLPDQFVAPLLDYLEANLGEQQLEDQSSRGPWAGYARVNPLWR